MDRNLVLQRAQSASISRDFSLAIRLYKSLLKESPSDVSLLNAIGSSYVKSGDDEKALMYYEQILTFSPHDVDAMNSMGAIYRRLKRYDDSINILQKAVDEGKNSATVNYNLGFTYKEMGNYDDAIEAFSLVVEENPSDVLAHNHLGSIYYQQKLYQKSIQAFKKGLQIDPNHPILHYNLAKCYEAENQYEDAIRGYEAALRAKPGWLDALKDFSNLLVKCQKTKEAQEVVKRSIALKPDDVNLLMLMGKIYLNEYDYDSAADSFSKVVSLDKMNVEGILSLADSLEKGQQPKQAVEVMDRAIASNGSNRDLKKKYVHTLLSAEDYENAYTHVESLYKDNGEKDVQVLDLYGQYYICVDDEQNARKYFDQIPSIDPEYKLYLLEAANRYSQIGKIKQAEDYANRYISANPKNPEAYNALGNIYSKAGEKENAIKSYGKGISIVPSNVYASRMKKELEQKLAADEKLDYLEMENDEDDFDGISYLPGENEDFDIASFGSPTSSKKEEKPEPQEDMSALADDELQNLEEPVPALMESAMEETEFPDFDDITGGDSYNTEDEFLDNPESTDISDIEPEPKEDDFQRGGEPLFEPLKDEDKTLSDMPENGSEESLPLQAEKPAEMPERIPEQKPEYRPEPAYSPESLANAKMAMDAAMQSMENLRAMEKSLREQSDMLDTKVEKMKNQLSDQLKDAMENKFKELKENFPAAQESVVSEPEIQENTEEDIQKVPDMLEEEKKEFAFDESEAIIENKDSKPGENEIMEKDEMELTNDFDFADVDNCFEELPETLDAPAEPEEDFSSVDDLFGEENHSNPEDENFTEIVEEELETLDAEDAYDVNDNLVQEDAPFEDVIAAAADVAAEADFPKNEEQKHIESLDPLESVKTMLPRIEMILKNTDYAYAHETELGVFKKIKAFCDFLPEDEKTQYQNSRMKMLLEFIIAKLEGKPGLLATAESLLKIGILGDCMVDRIYEKQNELIEKRIELQEEVRIVLEYMKELAGSLKSKPLAQALRAEADTVLSKLDVQSLC